MALFPLSLLLLKFNRGRIPRQYKAPLWLPILALALAFVILAGNLSIDPSTLKCVYLKFDLRKTDQILAEDTLLLTP